MLNPQKQMAAELLRRELATREMLPFVQLINDETYHAGWVHQDLCTMLDAFLEGVEKRLSPRLMVWLPPRAGKSQIVSRAFPAFILGKHPDFEVVNATYGQDLASDMGRYVRSILQSQVFHELFPACALDPATQAMDRIDTYTSGSGAFGRARGGYKAVGVGTALTGRGAHVLIVDDPVKSRQEADSDTIQDATWGWYTSVARTRLAPGGGIVVMQTRWAQGDLSGRILDQAKANPEADQWGVFSYPAIATQDEFDYATGKILRRRAGEPLHPERFSLKELKAIRASIGLRDWEALYMQNCIPAEGSYFRREWFKHFEVVE